MCHNLVCLPIKSFNKLYKFLANDNIHTSYISNLNYNEKYKWKLNYLCWNNLYCYGKHNYINFNNLNGLSVIIGKNKTGKSSIIDILIFALFIKFFNSERSGILLPSSCSNI